MTSRDEILRQDAEDLARQGYAQQLFREMGGFSNFAVSFSIISVPTGAVLLLGYGLKLAGPIVTVVFALPPNELVLWTTLLFALFLSMYWLAYARHHFRGPAAGGPPA